MSTADSKLDARLRAVPLPDGLLDRLMALPLADDEDVDKLVCDVAVPPGLLERLQAIALADDDGLDEALRDVPIPDDLVASCRHHAPPASRSPRGPACNGPRVPDQPHRHGGVVDLGGNVEPGQRDVARRRR